MLLGVIVSSPVEEGGPAEIRTAKRMTAITTTMKMMTTRAGPRACGGNVVGSMAVNIPDSTRKEIGIEMSGASCCGVLRVTSREALTIVKDKHQDNADAKIDERGDERDDQRGQIPAQALHRRIPPAILLKLNRRPEGCSPDKRREKEEQISPPMAIPITIVPVNHLLSCHSFLLAPILTGYYLGKKVNQHLHLGLVLGGVILIVGPWKLLGEVLTTEPSQMATRGPDYDATGKG